MSPSKKVLWLGFLFPLGSLFGFESPYTELASLLKNSARTIDSSVIQHFIGVKTTLPEENDRPREIFGTVNYSHGCGKRYCSNGGITFLGFDFSYNNFILKRVSSIGFLGGVAKDFIHYSCDPLKKGDLRTYFGSYYGNFHIFGCDISTVSLIGFSKSNVSCKIFSVNDQRFDHFTHDHRIIHSKIDLYYSWKWNGFKIGPNIALCADNLKQKGAKEWNQKSLRLKTIDSIVGIKCENDSQSFYAHLFLGGEFSVCKRWSGGEININGIEECFTRSNLDKAKILVTLGTYFHLNESCFLNINFSGRYGKSDKSSAVALTLNKIF